MAWGLKALSALPGNPDLIPSTYMIHNHPVPGDLTHFSSLFRCYIDVVHRRAYRQNTQIHKSN